MENIENKYISVRWIDGKKRKVIVDMYENIINRSPTKDDLKGLEELPSKKVLCANKEYLIGYMKRFYNENRRVPMCDDFSNNPRYPCFNTYIRIFGGWNNSIKEAGLWKRRYNNDHSCCRCGISFDEIEELGRTPIKECDEKGDWTGNWDCLKCWRKYDPNSDSNIQKRLANCRTGNIRSGCTQEKGDRDVELICTLYRYIDLNKKYDNHITEIDCLDEKTGLLYQVKGLHYNSKYKRWHFGHLEREYHKKYEDMIFVCKSEDWKIVEELYRIPSWELKCRKGVGIYKNPTDSWGNHITPWYEQYRVKDKEELKRANELQQKY